LPEGGGPGKGQNLRMHRHNSGCQAAVCARHDSFPRHNPEQPRLRHIRGEVGRRLGAGGRAVQVGNEPRSRSRLAQPPSGDLSSGVSSWFWRPCAWARRTSSRSCCPF
jgi:hypothetical protein